LRGANAIIVFSVLSDLRSLRRLLGRRRLITPFFVMHPFAGKILASDI